TLTTGTGVKSYLIYTGTPGVTHIVPLTFDTGLQHWFGSYTPQTSDPGGLWSLIVNATDSPSPPNTGSASTAVTLQDRPPVASFNHDQNTAKQGQQISLKISISDPDGTISTTRVDWVDTIVQLYSGAITSATHSYASTGSSTSQIFTIIITGTDNNASYTSASSQVTINDRVPVPSFNPSSTALITS